MENIIEIIDLHKSFGDIKAVNGLCFKVKKSELFAFLGVNGAGKSTTINMICAMLKKDQGKILINGLDCDQNQEQIKALLGVVFQNSVLDQALTVRDNLVCRAALYGIFGENLKQRIAELSEMLDLEPILNRPVAKLSGGQRRRADIARALIHKPEILILDEPTTGLDPQTRNMIWGVISDLRQNKGITVFLTTHYMEEAAEADFVVIIDAGKICAEGTPLTLKNAYTGDFITLYNADEKTVKSLGIPYTPTKGAFRLFVENTAAATELIIKHPSVFIDYEITKGKMDDVFLAVTGKDLRQSDDTSAQDEKGRNKK